MIRVLHRGIHLSVQDKGRFGFAKLGIPTSGFMDAYSAELANNLLGNPKDKAVLEITYGAGSFEFSTETLLSITGADFSAELNSKPLKLYTVHRIKKGDIISFGKRNYGARTYLAVQGGIQTEMVLGSQSFSPGITPAHLEENDVLDHENIRDMKKKTFSRIKVHHNHFVSPLLTCYPGPEFDQLNQNQQKQLFQPFTLSEDNNRVGYRLNEPLQHHLNAILTSAVFPGTVQLTPSGKLIILMRDSQVTGGYPRVLQLSEKAISRLSQKVARDEIRFKLIP